MKSKWLRSLAALALTTVTLSSAFALAASGQALQAADRQQLEAQISLFHEALSELGAATPEEAVRLWATGAETRNGVYQYAVSCPALKEQLLREMGPPAESLWTIGVSSPWMTGYEILQTNRLSPTEAAYRLGYHWATSTGAEPSTTQELLLRKAETGWCVVSAS